MNRNKRFETKRRRARFASLAKLSLALAALWQPACPAAEKVEIKIIAFNDFHGHLKTPGKGIAVSGPHGRWIMVPAGGAARFASAVRALKRRNPNHAVVSAGDLIGASPLESAMFLDEPTIEVFNEIGIDFNAVGNHEFDKGKDELLRMQNGGCARYTAREPCQLSKGFPGAAFTFLAANTFRQDGRTLFPATGIKRFGRGAGSVAVGFIGLTLRGTPGVVTPGGVQGLTFKDEAATANALVPRLKAQGADIIVVVVHQGGNTAGWYNDKSCPNLSGEIIPILEKLDPAVDVVVSGHTHRAYVCDYGKINPAKPFLLTAAGQYGTLVTDINLEFDPASRKLVKKSADNIVVRARAGMAGHQQAGETFDEDSAVGRIVGRYLDAAAPLAAKAVGRLSASITRVPTASGESPLGNLIADAQLAAARHVGAQLALMNPGGVRADLNLPVDGGPIRYGELFSVQPFGNAVVVKSMTGARLRALLEQQFHSGANTVAAPRVLFPSAGFTYSYDLKRPPGSRITGMRLFGKRVADAGHYRVAMNSFLATGGDDFTLFAESAEMTSAGPDIDALESYIRQNSPVRPPPTDRITRD